MLSPSSATLAKLFFFRHLDASPAFARWFDFAATFPLEDLMQTHEPSWNPLGPRLSHLGPKSHGTSSISCCGRPLADGKLTGVWFSTLLLQRPPGKKSARTSFPAVQANAVTWH